jgi:predicted AAA+ superfamily ATPase
MYNRKLESILERLFLQYPAIALIGPRQSGKTTLAKKMWPNLPYVLLEAPDIREYAEKDPRAFLQNYPDGAILDEIQNVPHLFSYLQEIIDQKDKPGLFILSGSQNFVLNEKITQTLAGRIAIVKLLPLSFEEFNIDESLDKLMIKGNYPRVHRYDLDPVEFYRDYVHTYIERDVRQIKNITNLSTFQKFLSLCAGRAGQLLNISNLSVEAGVSLDTVRSWLSVMEANMLIYILKPYYENYSKRIIKTPKLFFTDTGLVCYLLGIRSKTQLENHPLRGAIFENFMITEILKHLLHRNLSPDLYFFREQTGKEIDCLWQNTDKLVAVEMKSGSTINQDFFKHIEYWYKLTGHKDGFLIYAGDERKMWNNTEILPWQKIHEIFGI